ncbi:hypothetical protein [Brumimicrobium mesophilum]|uniref:hypothetical protein n=1 Tax=Brumimicrobium mesophilum TaxID=392717 RepID=UPI000D13ECC6|nr:hypothetical protein [Brumimicrobium mesophilum]
MLIWNIDFYNLLLKTKLSSAKKHYKQTLIDDNTFLVTSIATNKTYGLSPENPVEIGGANDMYDSGKLKVPFGIGIKE